jgi:RimJ/RimL family protein N-acetyltransferase
MSAAQPVLHGRRVTLRPRGPADAEALFATMSDPVAMHWWSRAPFTDVATLRESFVDDGGAWRSWAIVPAGQAVAGRAIGFVSAGDRRQSGVSEIGYLLARDAWGQGLARAAVAVLIDWLFAQGRRRVCADTDPDNRASNALLTRLGFRREGLLRAEWETHIGVRDSVIWGLLRHEWRGAAAVEDAGGVAPGGAKPARG